MSKAVGINKQIALLQLSIKNISFLQKNLSATEFLDLINKIYIKIKNILKNAYIYKFTGKDFFIVLENIEEIENKENAFYFSKEILDKLKKHNEFLRQHHIPEIEFTIALDFGEVIIGKVVYGDTEKTIITGIPFQNTQRMINLNERKNITPFLFTENVYTDVQYLLTEYIISVMGFIKIENRDLYLYGSYQFNK